MRGAHREQPLGPDPHLARCRIEADHIERLGLTADLEALPLAHGEVDDALVLPQGLTGRGMNDGTGGRALGPHLGDDPGVVPIGHEADVLRIRLGRVAQARRLGEGTHLRLGHPAQREAQVIELRLGRAIKEIRLVARRIVGAVQFDTVRARHAADIVSGRKAIRTQLARHAEQVGELGPHVAADAGHRGAPRKIFVGELFDHFLAKGAFVVEDIVRDPQPVGHGARVTNVVAGAACALAPRRRAVIIELERDPDHLRAAGMGEGGDHRAVDPAAHRHHDPARRSRARQTEQRSGFSGGHQAGVEDLREGHGPARI